MCVIICCESEFPSLDTLKNAGVTNPHGGGIAWTTLERTIKYKKDIDAEEIHKIIHTEAQLPAIIHFRIASVGSVVPELCHPFPISADVSLDLEGESTNVLFHNGTWREWDEVLMQSITSGKVSSIPSGAWSDSRCMALLAHTFGNNILNLIDSSNKIAILTPLGIIKYGNGWVNVANNNCSNNYFIPSPVKAVSKKDKKKGNSSFFFGGDALSNFWAHDDREKYKKHNSGDETFQEWSDIEGMIALDGVPYDDDGQPSLSQLEEDYNQKVTQYNDSMSNNNSWADEMDMYDTLYKSNQNKMRKNKQ